ncbi:OmpA family peptidoglycan-associated protein [Candidatus Bandiella woodruffii]|uniref:Peptidoglycan-associated lipoprotein n=2 Tax=Candidatus Bandiella euplotis TaxID=1664265 RepID=A0ABZ0ULK1_9RICK|nr:OmpA family peptidoglycan-associated protein [Candidatus Bandiella woodruffii]
MKKLPLTVCLVALMAVGCTHKSQQKNNLGDDSSSVSHATLQEFETKVGDKVYFAFDSSALSNDARATLDKQVGFMKEYPNLKFVIEGHCDKRGTIEYNLALGERRANSEKEYLVQNGVNPDRVTVISFGKEKPAVEGDTEEAFSQNRRGVTVIR